MSPSRHLGSCLVGSSSPLKPFFRRPGAWPQRRCPSRKWSFYDFLIPTLWDVGSESHFDVGLEYPRVLSSTFWLQEILLRTSNVNALGRTSRSFKTSFDWIAFSSLGHHRVTAAVSDGVNGNEKWASKRMRKRLFLDFGCTRLAGFFLLDKEQLLIGGIWCGK